MHTIHTVITALTVVSVLSLGAAKSGSPPSPPLWPNGVIPYTISEAVGPDLRGRIVAAVNHWSAHTPIRLVERTTEADYVAFTSGTDLTACASAVGRLGGRQDILLPATCTTGDIIHEIGHAVGLQHQHNRADRNRYVTVLYENILYRYRANFDRISGMNPDLGPYDFNSIMHYGAYDFSLDETAPSIETVPAGIPIGQRVRLSAGDIASVRRLYGFPFPGVSISTTPSGLQLIVDGAPAADGAIFNWAPGSRHTLEAIEQQFTGRVRYLFASWSDGGARTHEITVAKDEPLIIANYIRQRNLSLNIVPAGAGTISVEPESAGGYYTERSSIQLSATPARGYSFLNWSAAPSMGANPKMLAVNQPLDITATFTTAAITTIRSVPAGRAVMIDGVPVTTPRNFAWIAGEPHVISAPDASGDSVRYRFSMWEDGGDQTRTVTGEMSEFTARYSVEYPLTIYSPGPIEVAPKSADAFYPEGSVVRLRALAGPAPAWTGDVSGSLNPVVVTMDSGKAIWAMPASAAPPPFVIVNAASQRTTAVTPGQMIAIYPAGSEASSLGSPSCAASAANTNTAVRFDGVPARVVCASPAQITAIVPASLRGQLTSTVTVRWDNGELMSAPTDVALQAPALFTADGSGRGQALAWNQDGTANASASAASPGSMISVYAAGLGIDNVTSLTLRIAGQPTQAEVVADSTLPSGVIQIRARIPVGVPRGAASVYLADGDEISPPGVTITIQ